MQLRRSYAHVLRFMAPVRRHVYQPRRGLQELRTDLRLCLPVRADESGSVRRQLSGGDPDVQFQRREQYLRLLLS